MGKKKGKKSASAPADDTYVEGEDAEEVTLNEVGEGDRLPADLEDVKHNGGDAGIEDLDSLLSRHKRELREHQNQMRMLLKKAKQTKNKGKIQEAEAEIQNLDGDIAERHRSEEAELRAKLGDSQVSKLTEALEGLTSSSNETKEEEKKPTKAQKRRLKKTEQEAAREAQILEEQANIVSEREVENEAIQKKLDSLNLRIKEVESDGHCMYRALAHQLEEAGRKIESPLPYRILRKRAAEFMKGHPDDFLPFVANDAGDDDLEGHFAKYCDRVMNTADWGGHLELQALSHALQTPITVFSARNANIHIGEEYSSAPPLLLTYHHHYYALGEHYNSVARKS